MGSPRKDKRIWKVQRLRTKILKWEMELMSRAFIHRSDYETDTMRERSITLAIRDTRRHLNDILEELTSEGISV